MGGPIDQGCGQGVAVGVGVVGQHVAGEGAVLADGIRIVVRDGGIVDRVDGDRHGCNGTGAGSVADGVGEAVGAVVVGVRGVGEGAIRVERQGAVCRSVDEGGGEGIAVDIAVIGEHARRQAVVLVECERVVLGDGGVVDGVDGDRDGGGVARRGAVGDGVGEGVGAVVVRIRGVGEGAVSVEGEGAVGGSVDQSCCECVRFGVSVV